MGGFGFSFACGACCLGLIFFYWVVVVWRHLSFVLLCGLLVRRFTLSHYYYGFVVVRVCSFFSRVLLLRFFLFVCS